MKKSHWMWALGLGMALSLNSFADEKPIKDIHIPVTPENNAPGAAPDTAPNSKRVTAKKIKPMPDKPRLDVPVPH